MSGFTLMGSELQSLSCCSSLLIHNFYRIDQYAFAVFYVETCQPVLGVLKKLGATVLEGTAEKTGSRVAVVTISMGDFLLRLGVLDKIYEVDMGVYSDSDEDDND